jgi:hypothetical protein
MLFTKSPTSSVISTHAKGKQARVLLASVFGPYAQNDEFGSRVSNPMELYHNQVIRAQGAFSLRMFHRSWGIMMIQTNTSAPCTVLDFPTREAFECELTATQYDIVGISSIITNVGQGAGNVPDGSQTLTRLDPRSGGHVTAIPTIDSLVDADHFVRDEGISWILVKTKMPPSNIRKLSPA